jgi:hypothetical protein
MVKVVPDKVAEFILGWLDTKEDVPSVAVRLEIISSELAKDRLKNSKVKNEINLNFKKSFPTILVVSISLILFNDFLKSVNK